MNSENIARLIVCITLVAMMSILSSCLYYDTLDKREHILKRAQISAQPMTTQADTDD